MPSEPGPHAGSEGDYLAAYLRFYRETVVAKCRTLPDAELRRPRLPSGWTPLELLRHLAYVERRWFVWGFLGEAVADPWDDHVGGEPDGRWIVPPGTTLEDVVTMLEATARRTEAILAAHAPEELAATGGRFESDPPDLRWLGLHVLQEYARHAGHLDVVVELAVGPTGE